MNKTAVVIFNLGGPDSLQAVEPFLANLFSDRDIFKLPFQGMLARYIARKRAPRIVKEYELIGGKSPLPYWTELQRKMLEDRLNKVAMDSDGRHYDVFTAMRYWHPMTETAAKAVLEGGYDNVILLPLYPHYSVSTTGSSFNEWDRVMQRLNGKDARSFEEVRIFEYHDDPSYIRSINERINETLKKFSEPSRVHILFSAHGTPVSYVKKGDPYSLQIKETVELVMKARAEEQTSLNSHSLSFQSKVGPVKWLQPYTDDAIRELSQQGKKHLLVVPISFVSDHVETLYELDIEYRHVADEAGIKEYIVMTGLNDSPLFIDSLARLVVE